MDDDLTDAILDVLSRASMGDLDARVDIDPTTADSDDPLSLIAGAVNVVLDDLAYRQQEREHAVAAASEARAKEELLAFLSHDMKTPLAMLLGTLSILETSPTDQELSDALPIMRRAAGRLERFVQQFLDLARLGAERPILVRLEQVAVLPVVERVATMFADKGEVTIEADPGLPHAQADEERVEQIIANLVSNAFRYAGKPNDVTIRIGSGDGTVTVEVSDYGVGMDAEDLAQIFGRFERGSTSAGTTGTGLGLYLSRELAEAQGGSLEARSIPGSGSQFTLTLRAVGAGN